MIFVTVGTQLPFDRLITAVDEWAATNREQKVVMQSGKGDFSPLHCEACGYVEPTEWEKLFSEASFVIAHAGMGTILKCLDACKPLIVMPRQGSLGEHRNDHQMATASQFIDVPGVIVVHDSEELIAAIQIILNGKCQSRLSQPENLNRLITELQQFADIQV